MLDSREPADLEGWETYSTVKGDTNDIINRVFPSCTGSLELKERRTVDAPVYVLHACQNLKRSRCCIGRPNGKVLKQAEVEAVSQGF